MAFNLKCMVFLISLKFKTLHREIRTTCSVNTLLVDRQLRKFKFKFSAENTYLAIFRLELENAILMLNFNTFNLSKCSISC